MHFLLQGIFLTQGSYPHLLLLLHCRQISLPLSHRGRETNLGGTNFNFQMKEHVYKMQSHGVSITNLKRPLQKLLSAAHAIVVTENPVDTSVISSKNAGLWAVLKFAAALELFPLLAASLLEPSLTRSRQPSRSQGFWCLLITGLTTTLPQKSLHLPSIDLCDRLSSVLWARPSRVTTRELTQWV